MTVDIATLAIRVESLEAQNATRELNRLREAGGQAESATDGLTDAFKRYLGPAAAVAAILKTLQKTLAIQREFDSLNASLITATGSARNAAQAFNALQAFAATTPYGLSEVTKAFIQMRNLGLDPSEAALRSYGNTAAAMGKTLEQMVGAVADAATGEFERLKEFGIKSKIQGDQVKFTFQGASTLVGNSAREIEGYLKMLGDTKFAGGMELQANTLNGAISNLGDTWDQTFLAIAQSGIGDAMQSGVLGASGALADLTAIIDSMSSAIDKNGKKVEEASILHRAITTVFETVAVIGVNVAYVFTQIGKELGGLAAQAKAIATGDFAGAKAIGVMMRAEAEEDRKMVDAKTEKILWAATIAKNVREKEAAEKLASRRDDLAQFKVEQAAAGLSAAEMEKRAKAAKKEAEAYASLMVSIKEKLAATSQEAAGLKPLNDAQKLQISLDEQIAAGKLKLTPLHKAEYEAKVRQFGINLALIESNKAAADAKAKADGEVEAIVEQTAALQLQFESYNKLPAAITAMTIAKLQAKGVALETNEGTEAEILHNNRLIAVLQTRAEWESKVATQDVSSNVTKAKELLDILVAVDQATKSAADGMAESFGRVGSAIGGLTTALSGYAVQQQAIMAQLAAAKADPKNGPDKIAKLEIAAANASAQAKIKSYGDMAGAAKGFFKESSKGYKAMEGAEKAYRAYEMAMAIKTMVEKSGLLTAFTGLFVASKTAETAATTASVAPDVAASMAKGQAAAAAGVAGQAQGDPYTAWARMAAMAAAMAAIGFAVSSGSKGDTTAEDRQAAQGTGSVFGDKSAKSESIARSIELSATNSSIELSYTQGMLRALLGIQNSLQGLGNLLIRGSGITSDVPATTYGGMENSARWIAGFDKILGGFVGKITGSLMNSVFGGRTTALDTGLTANRVTVGQASAGGLRASQYLDTKKDGGWFRSDKYRTEYTALGGEANAQFSKIISDMAGAIGEAGKLLGFGGDAFTQRLNNFVVDIGKISLKDLTGEQIQEQLEAVFSKVGDDMARFAISGLQPFQRVGEGYLETLTRIAVNYSNLDSVLKSLGMTFGSTGLASIAARENLLLMTGGIDELAGKASSFADNYMTEAERLAPVRAYVEEQLGAIGLAHLKSRDAFKNHLLALNPTIDAERLQIAALFDLQDAFARVYAGTVDLTKSQQEIADERADLQTQLDEMMLTSAQLRAKERAAVDASNRSLYDQVMMQRDLKESTQAASEALKKTVDGLISTKTSSLAYRDSLLLGSLSDLTPMQKYAETQRQYAVAMAEASANPADSAAASGAQSAATAWLTASQVINASSSAFIGDKAKVLSDMDKLAAIAGVRMTDAQLQLSALDKQVAGITQLNETAAAIERALLNEHTPAAMSTPVFDVQRYGANSSTGMEVLAAEVRALRAQNADVVAELKLRRADAERQKTELVDATEGAGETTVKGVSEALKDVSYRVLNPTRVSAR